jgi:exonuclease SbcC
MIKLVHLWNFLSHYDTLIELDPGLNVFIGHTDSGKSAIIKALKWVVWNRPLGDSIRSWKNAEFKKGDTAVQICVDENQIVRRKGNIDLYELNNTEFKAFGTNVPDEITKALNISELNLQNQLDSHFLLSETPGDVASFWNRIAHLEKIDIGTANVNSAIRELTSDIKYSEGQEKILVESLKKFDHLKQFESEVKELESLQRQFEDLTYKENKLQELINDLYELKGDIAKWQKILSLEKPVNDLLLLYKERDTLFEKVFKLGTLLQDFIDIGARIDIQKDVLAAEKPINDLLQLYEQRKILTERQKRLFAALSSLSSINASITTQKANYETLHKQFEEAMGEECFFCGQPIKKVV